MWLSNIILLAITESLTAYKLLVVYFSRKLALFGGTLRWKPI